MNLLLVIHSLESGGAERVMSQLANHWKDQGHHVTIVTFKAGESFYPLNQGVRHICLQGPHHGAGHRTFWERIKSRLETLGRLRKLIKNPVFYDVSGSAVREFGASGPWDKVISFMDITNIFVLIMSRGLNVPVIVCERSNPHFHRLSKFYDLLRGWTYPWAEKVVCQTMGAASYFQKSLQKKIVIIPNAVSFPKGQAPLRERIEHIVSVGRLDEGKDHLTLIRAFHLLARKHKELRLTIYGEGPLRERLECVIEALDLQGVVRLPGKTKDVTAALCQGDLFVFPSRYEGFPNALGEAMAVGLPVIASDCSGNIDIVQDGIDGYLFPVGDVAYLAELMSAVLSKDKAERQHLVQEAKKVTDRFKVEDILLRWAQVLQGKRKL